MSLMEASMNDRAASLSGAGTDDSVRRLWPALSAAWAAITGLLPHVLHHVGPLAGAALVAGVGGSLLFGALGLIVSIPFLRRLHRRFGTWRAPAMALAIFVAVFSLSTFIIGPQISGEDEGATSGGGGSTSSPAGSGHEAHHE
jgi:hypothetical protein